jgi:hypothetical protein
MPRRCPRCNAPEVRARRRKDRSSARSRRWQELSAVGYSFRCHSCARKSRVRSDSSDEPRNGSLQNGENQHKSRMYNQRYGFCSCRHSNLLNQTWSSQLFRCCRRSSIRFLGRREIHALTSAGTEEVGENLNWRSIEASPSTVSAIAKCWPTHTRGPIPNGA